MHVGGIKRDFDWRVTCFDRAMQAGIDDVGIGVLFGLYDWKFEVLAMKQHIRAPRRRPSASARTRSACRGSSRRSVRPWPTRRRTRCRTPTSRRSSRILRLAVPYTGIIMSTRENAATRRATFELGVSQISAGSRCNPGGYAESGDGHNAEQFQLGDHRSLDEVVRDVASLGYTPSFCTACYRLGRTGADFMDLAKPGLIKHHCAPNALSSCMEYLLDYAKPETRKVGENLIAHELDTHGAVGAGDWPAAGGRGAGRQTGCVCMKLTGSAGCNRARGSSTCRANRHERYFALESRSAWARLREVPRGCACTAFTRRARWRTFRWPAARAPGPGPRLRDGEAGLRHDQPRAGRLGRRCRPKPTRSSAPAGS